MNLKDTDQVLDVIELTFTFIENVRQVFKTFNYLKTGYEPEKAIEHLNRRFREKRCRVSIKEYTDLGLYVEIDDAYKSLIGKYTKNQEYVALSLQKRHSGVTEVDEVNKSDHSYFVNGGYLQYVQPFNGKIIARIVYTVFIVSVSVESYFFFFDTVYFTVSALFENLMNILIYIFYHILLMIKNNLPVLFFYFR